MFDVMIFTVSMFDDAKIGVVSVALDMF